MQTIESNSAPPETDELASFARDMDHIMDLHNFFKNNEERFTLFTKLRGRMKLPEDFFEVFSNAFDDDDNLNAEKYPAISAFRNRINATKSKIIQRMQSILSDQSMKEKLSDTGYTVIEGRYCLMLKNTYKKGVGIVHGSSNTGRTIYVEPMDIVEVTNEMKSLTGQLRAEENRILLEMCRSISQHRVAVRACLDCVMRGYHISLE